MEWNDLIALFGNLWNASLFALGESHITLGGMALSLVALIVLWRGANAVRLRVFLPLLGRTTLERGTQFAIARMGYYVFLVLGTLVVLDTLGVSFGSLAVLGGLVGIGIGFGMQNVTSNFVSGIILLVERPVRVGDMVSVGDEMGVIKSISIRVTRILSLDNVMLYVPNSRFIDDTVINWSSEDAKVRAHLTVGVSYGSDIELVRRILLDVAERHPNVLKDPKPNVWFTDFGDSSLNFELLVWIVTPADRFDAVSDLRFAVTKAFREHDIEIPFPQRDLHLRTAIPLPVEAGAVRPPDRT